MIDPSEGVSEQLSMGCSNYELKIFFAEIALFLFIEESKERYGVTVGDIGDGLAIWFNDLIGDNNLSQYFGKDGPGSYAKPILLIVRHSLEYK